MVEVCQGCCRDVVGDAVEDERGTRRNKLCERRGEKKENEGQKREEGS